ncbi:hypothetical protein MPTK1_1g04120 [Marchantia polymorpha subsp. ruderalis]|uniref:EF-hand domain-containing protein n=2 Tax=Marchantia polymorpha TaxID=3197 RepID=A0AAF6ALB8_MARPO|nr:hypothetical protein MARPO_0005s0195 [Marchantia polymorpha]BBM97238.1 hypothetical protein Mp_1g04120 [Marchantia polymorpha subsp. ruderalis]|eukprot:PTQ48570.1 hypothetical protein MARPO_0005s0195 [Marchantia polymorpha]
MVLPIFFVYECLLFQFRKMGAKCIKALNTARAKLKGRNLDIADFKEFLSYTNTRLNPEEMTLLMKTHCPDDKCFSFMDMMEKIRGTWKKHRERLVNFAFKKLDKEGSGKVSIDRVKEMYNAAVHPDVMCDRITKEEALQEYLDKSFAELDSVSQADFLEYYLLHYGDMVCETAFELRMMKDYKVQHDEYDVDNAINKVKLIVYKGRIRSREFIKQHDPLRHRLISDTQFARAIDLTKIVLDTREVKAICDNYRMPDEPLLRVCWTAFCDEIDTVFTYKEMEKTPLRNVPPIPPLPGLAPTRFMVGCKNLGLSKEQRVNFILKDIKKICYDRRLCTQPFFEDFAHGKMSCNVVGHVTYAQFGAALNSEAGLRILPADLKLLQEKYDDLNNGMCNYFAFSNEIDPFAPANQKKGPPPEPPRSPYPRMPEPPYHDPVPGNPDWKIEPHLLGGDKKPLMKRPKSPRPPGHEGWP